MGNTAEKLLDCGHYPSAHSDITTGYGKDNTGRTFCYECCAKQDRDVMDNEGRITLYLAGGEVLNWPGSLRFTVFRQTIGKHNIARKRYDVWFRDHKGKTWHGVQYGDNTQLCHCRRLKD